MWQGICFGTGMVIGLMVPSAVLIFFGLTAGWLIERAKLEKKRQRDFELAQCSTRGVLMMVSTSRSTNSIGSESRRYTRMPVVTCIRTTVEESQFSRKSSSEDQDASFQSV